MSAGAATGAASLRRTPLEETIYDALLADVDLAALVSTRVYHHRMPQEGDVPCVIFQRVGGGVFQARDTIVASAPRFQFDVWAELANDTLVVRDALLAALLGLWGTVGEVQIIEEADHEDMRSRLCRRRIDVRFIHAGP